MSLALQKDIYRLQDFMLEQEQAETEVVHHFSEGLYARELRIPAGVCVVGAFHRTTHLFMVSMGKCIAVSHDDRQEIQAPYMGETKPNTKRMIYAETDTIWTTFHVTDETDVDKIAEQILVPEIVK